MHGGAVHMGINLLARHQPRPFIMPFKATWRPAMKSLVPLGRNFYPTQHLAAHIMHRRPSYVLGSVASAISVLDFLDHLPYSSRFAIVNRTSMTWKLLLYDSWQLNQFLHAQRVQTGVTVSTDVYGLVAHRGHRLTWWPTFGGLALGFGFWYFFRACFFSEPFLRALPALSF